MSSNSYPVHLELTEEDLQLIYDCLDLGVSKSKGIINRSKAFPSETFRSRETIKKHEDILEHIEELRSHIAENSTR